MPRRSASRRPSARPHRPGPHRPGPGWPARNWPGQASAATGSGGGTPGSAIAKICAEPSSGAVLTTGSHRKPAGAPAAAIRVDQVGYPSGAAKLAEIMTKARPSRDLHWVLVRAGSCTVAASGVARQNLGSWSKRYGWVWAARFTGVRAPGQYRVGILGDASAASPWFSDRPGRAAVRTAAGQRAVLLPERAGRPGLHPQRAAQRARSSQRRQRDDLPHPAGRRQRQLPGQPGQVRDRGADQRDRRLVRRRGLPAFRRDDQLHRGRPAAGRRVVPPADGITLRHRLHRRGQVRPGLPAADVARALPDAVLRGRHRRGEQLLPRGPRHLAAAAGR